MKLFENITYLDEYYLTNAEIDALTRHANAIVEHIPAGARVVELGSGCVISFLLHLPLDSDSRPNMFSLFQPRFENI